MRSLKLSAAVAFVALSIGIVTSHLAGSLWPGFSLSVLVAGLAVLVGVRTNDGRTNLGLAVFTIVTIGVVYRIYTFLYPASLHGVDPDSLAGVVISVVQTGEIAVTISFYARAPAFFLLGASSQLVTGLPTQDAFVIYPLILGILFPLGSIAGINQLYPFRTDAMLLTGIVGALVASSVLYAYITIPNSLAIGIWMVLLVALLRYFDRDWTVHSKAMYVILLLLCVLTVTHKFAVVPFVAIMAGMFVLSLSHTDIPPAPTLILAVISVVVLATQWTVLTNFGSVATFSLFTALYGESIQVAGDPSPQLSRFIAHHPYGSLGDLLLRRVHGMVVAGFAGVAWLLTVPIRRDMKTTLLLLVSAVGGVFIFAGTVISRLPMPRMLAYATPSLVLLLGVAYAILFEPSRSALVRAPATVAVVLLLLTQVVSPAAAPDMTTTPREYLNAQEVAGRQYTNEYVSETVRADVFYAHETIELEHEVDYRPKEFLGKYHPIGYDLLTGDLLSREYKYVLFRPQVQTYGVGGWWILDWNPEEELQKRYNVVYDNGEAVLFSRPPD